jgi:5-methylcytosine-specific restriction endonuclease McrA
MGMTGPVGDVHPAKKDELRRDVYARENRRCFWCGRRVRLHWRGQQDREEPPADAATLDRIIPASQGGTYRLDNLVCACHECNQKRGNMRADRFLRRTVESVA